MKTRGRAVWVAAVCLWAQWGVAEPLQTAFTYQGQLKQAGVPVSDTVDLRFQLLGDESGTTLVGNEIPLDAVDVVNGLFTVELDLGAEAFDRDARWLRVSVRAPHDPSDTGEFTTLSPNAPISPTPYALQTRGIFVSETGSVGVGTGPFVADADLQVGVDPVTNTVFGGSTVQVGDASNAQLILGRPGADFMQMVTSTFGNRLAVVGSNGMDFRTGPILAEAQSRLFISSAGNVGVGTATPTARLEIAAVPVGPTLQIPNTLTVGRVQPSGEDRPFVGIGRSTPLGGTELLALEAAATANNPWVGMYINANGANGLSFYGYVTSTAAAWSYLGSFDGAWRLHVGNFDPVTVTSDGKIGLGGSFPNPTNTLSVFGTADVQGNLGVGTIAPTNRLSVSGSANVSTNLGIGIAAPERRLHVVGGTDINTGGTGGYLMLGASTAANLIVDENEIQSMSNGAVASLALNALGGNVGIGVLSPGNALHIGGDVRVDGGTGYNARNPNNVGGQLILGWLNDLARVRVGGSDPGGSNGLDFQTLGDRSLMRLLNNGNVGIGTTTPETLLHLFKGDAGMASAVSNTLLTLEDDAAHFLRLMVPDAAETGVTFGNPTNGVSAAGVIFGGVTPNGLQFRTGTNNTRMVIDSSGRVGIGTTAPETKMEIVSSGSALRLTSQNTSLPLLELKSGADTFPEAGGIRFIDMNDEIEWSLHMDTFGDFSIGVGTRDIVSINRGFPDVVDIGNDAIIRVQASSPEFDGIVNVTRQLPGRLVRFSDADNSNPNIVGEIGNITYNASNVVSYNAFTGGHYAWSGGSFEEGAVVSMTGVNRRPSGDGRGEPVYGIKLCSAANDPAVLGAYSQPMPINGESDTHIVSSVGNGDMCIVDRGGGDVEPGDYLISSDVAGCAMKDDAARFAVGHVIAKAADRVRWGEIRADESGVRRVRASVLFESFVRDSRGDGLQTEIRELRDRIVRLEAALLQATAARGEDRK